MAAASSCVIVPSPSPYTLISSCNRYRWSGGRRLGHFLGACDLVATRDRSTARIAGNRRWIAWHEVIRRRTRYGRLGSGDSLLRCIRSSVDLLLDQPQDTVFDEKG